MNVLTMTAGKPWSRVIEFKDAQNIWANLSEVEVLSQLRVGETTTSAFISNLHTFMTLAFSGNDIVVAWSMSGQQTRDLYNLRWGPDKTGYFTINLTDVGAADVRALIVPVIQLKCDDVTTTASGVL